MKQKLKKPCKRCGESFIPTTKNSTLCKKCIKKSNIKRMLNNRITYNKKKHQKN